MYISIPQSQRIHEKSWQKSISPWSRRLGMLRSLYLVGKQEGPINKVMLGHWMLLLHFSITHEWIDYLACRGSTQRSAARLGPIVDRLWLV